MTFMEFDDHDQMLEYLAAARQAANQSMHPLQAALTGGDHWAQFYDIAQRVIIFGYIHTLTEVFDGEVNAGATRREAQEVRARTAADLEDGMMFGRAYSVWEELGELGYTHKASVWPISTELFEAAREVAWRVDYLPLADKITLEALFQTERQHRRSR